MRLIDLAPLFWMTRFEELGQGRLGLLDAAVIVGVARDPTARRPAVNERNAIELQVVGNLRRPIECVVECRVEAMHEDERMVFERLRFCELRSH